MRDRRTFVFEATGTVILILALFFLLSSTQVVILAVEGVAGEAVLRVFAAPSVYPMGLLLAFALRLLGVQLRGGSYFDLLPAFLVFLITAALSKTPLWSGYDRDFGFVRMSILYAAFAGCLLLSFLEGFAKGERGRRPTRALPILLAASLALALSLPANRALQGAALDGIMNKEIGRLLALLCALAAAALASFAVTSPGRPILPALIGLFGIAVYAATTLLHRASVSPFSIPLFRALSYQSQIGVANTDALMVYLFLFFTGVAGCVRHRKERA